MPDITMCQGQKCPLKNECYRFLATPSKYNQSYFLTAPVGDDGTCKYFDQVEKGKEK